MPIPAGVGVRDLVLTAMLMTTLSGAEAVLVVIVSRLMLIAVDMGFALLALSLGG